MIVVLQSYQLIQTCPFNIITSSEGGKICIWSSLTWSLVKTLQYGFGGAKDICCIKSSNRVVFGFCKELVMVELTLMEGETAEVSDQSDEESLGVEKNDEENIE